MRASEPSGIIRTVKDTSHPFKLVNKTFAEDNRLTWEARGVMAYLLVKPDNWQVRFNDLLKQAKCGRDRLRRILSELETHGYLLRERIHVAGGKFEWVSTIYETPQPIDVLTIDGKHVDGKKRTPKPKRPSTENTSMAPSTDLPYMVNTSIYKESNLTDHESHETPSSSGDADDFIKALIRDHNISPKKAREIAATGVDPATAYQSIRNCVDPKDTNSMGRFINRLIAAPPETGRPYSGPFGKPAQNGTSPPANWRPADALPLDEVMQRFKEKHDERP